MNSVASPSFKVGMPASNSLNGDQSLIRFQRMFLWGLIAFILAVLVTAHPLNAECMIGGFLIIAASLLPIWIWFGMGARGLPLFQIQAGTYITAFAFPLIYAHPVVANFQPADQLRAALTVTAFLVLGTFVWWYLMKQPAKPLSQCLQLSADGADAVFLMALAGGAFLNMATLGNWLIIPTSLLSAVRAIALALEALACFALSYRSAQGILGWQKQVLLRILLCVLIISTLPGLLLINAMSLFVVAALGYTLGARRIPWRLTTLAIFVATFLHSGKGDVREIYWHEDESISIQPTDYPGLLAQWTEISAENLTARKSEEGDESQSLLNRASLMQLLLYEQAMSPGDLPYLYGETYALIPGLLIPRVLDPEKVASHEGTYLLNIYYGFQTREATETTTIGFGLLNEAFANFGYWGVGGLAVLLGAFYALVARWSENAPVLSFRSLFAVIVASYAFESEFAAGVYVAALFQSTVALCGLALVLMRTARVTTPAGVRI